MFGKSRALLVLGRRLCLAGTKQTAAQKKHLNSPDLGVTHTELLTVDADSSVVEAIAIRDGNILSVGGNASIKVGGQTGVAGKTVVPGLVGAHAHFKADGMADHVVNVSRKRAVEASAMIKAFAKKMPRGWIVSDQWHPPNLEGALHFYACAALRCAFKEERKGALQPGKLASRCSPQRTA